MCWWRQLLEGLSHIHKYGVAHCDIKPENLVLDEKGDLSLIDFGSAIYQFATSKGKDYHTVTPL